MTEFHQGLVGSLALIPSTVFSVFYWFGGRDKNYLGIRARLWKRVIAPLTFALLVASLSLLVGNWKWWYLLGIPSYLAASSMGYGGDTILVKILRRMLWSGVWTLACLPFCIPNGTWIRFFLQLIFGLSASVILGVSSKLKSPQEEGLIGFTSVYFVPFMVLP